MRFGCALCNKKFNHHIVRVKASKMNAFIPHATPGTPPNQASMLSTLMAVARARYAVFIRFILDDENELEIDNED